MTKLTGNIKPYFGSPPPSTSAPNMEGEADTTPARNQRKEIIQALEQAGYTVSDILLTGSLYLIELDGMHNPRLLFEAYQLVGELLHTVAVEIWFSGRIP